MWDEDTAVAEQSPLATRTAGEIVSQGLALRQTQTNYVTAVAVQQPRNLRECERKLIEEASLLGEDAFYSWSAGGDRVEGPSVNLALAAVRCFKNTVVEALPVQETPAAYIFTSAIIDLENGVTVTRQFRQAKSWTVHGRLDEARKEDIRFQIGQSKSHRNVILHALPSWFIERGFQAAKEGVRKKIEQYIKTHSMEAARKLMLDAFKKVGVTEEMILQKIERPTVPAVTVDDMVMLQGDLRAIETGAESAETLFPNTEPTDGPSEGQTAERVRERLRQRREPSTRDNVPRKPQDERTSQTAGRPSDEETFVPVEDVRARLMPLAEKVGAKAKEELEASFRRNPNGYHPNTVQDMEEHLREQGGAPTEP